MTTGKTEALTLQTFVGRAVSLLFNTLLGLCHCFDDTVKAVVFLGVMYGCKSWIIKEAERQRIDAFKLRFWRRLLKVRWTARRSSTLNIHWKD